MVVPHFSSSFYSWDFPEINYPAIGFSYGFPMVWGSPMIGNLHISPSWPTFHHWFPLVPRFTDRRQRDCGFQGLPSKDGYWFLSLSLSVCVSRDVYVYIYIYIYQSFLHLLVDHTLIIYIYSSVLKHRMREIISKFFSVTHRMLAVRMTSTHPNHMFQCRTISIHV